MEGHDLEIKAQRLIKHDKFLEASEVYCAILREDNSSYDAKIQQAYCLREHATKEVKDELLVARDECDYDLKSLNEAWALIERLIIYDKAKFNHEIAETGASINKYLFRYFWAKQNYDKARKNLDIASKWYKEGAKTCYRNGEGYVICCYLKLCYFPEDIEDKKAIAILISNEVKNIINLCQNEKNTDEWIHATLAKCYWLQGNKQESESHEKLFCEKCNGEQWKMDAYQEGCRSIKPIKEICQNENKQGGSDGNN